MVARHPLLGATVKGRRFGEATWMASPDGLPPVDFGDLGEKMTFPDKERIDLHSETGLRIWVRSSADACTMRFQFHHACCDGVGIYQFLDDLLCLYAREEGQSFEDTRVQPNARFLGRRTRFGLTRWQILLRLPLDIVGVPFGLALLLLRRVACLSSPTPPAERECQARALPDFPVRTLTELQLAQLHAGRRAAGATLNECLLRDLFLAKHEWNRKQTVGTANRPVRILVPVDLRGPDDAALPATNAVGMIPVDRRVWLYQDRDKLLATIRLDMKIVKRLRLGVIWIHGLNVLSRVPGAFEFLVRWPLSNATCVATCVLSNSGTVFGRTPLPRQDGRLVVGSLLLDSVSSAPPVRPGMSAAFTVLSYAGRLTLVMNYDRTHFTECAAHALMDTVITQVEKTIATA